MKIKSEKQAGEILTALTSLYNQNLGKLENWGGSWYTCGQCNLEYIELIERVGCPQCYAKKVIEELENAED